MMLGIDFFFIFLSSESFDFHPGFQITTTHSLPAILFLKMKTISLKNPTDASLGNVSI